MTGKNRRHYHCKALNSLLCADVPLRNYSHTHSRLNAFKNGLDKLRKTKMVFFMDYATSGLYGWIVLQVMPYKVSYKVYEWYNVISYPRDDRRLLTLTAEVHTCLD